MKNKIIGATTALLLALISVALTAESASAHTGDMDVSAVCNTVTGEYDFTVNLTITQTGLAGVTQWDVGTGSFTGTPSSASGLTRGPVNSSGAGTITLGYFSLPGTTTGLGPWVYAHTTWSDGFPKGSDDQLRENERLTGNCVKPEIPVGKADWGFTPANCNTGQGFVLGEATNATWNADALAAVGKVGPAAFDISATLVDDAEWTDGQNGTFHVVLGGPDRSLCLTNTTCTTTTAGPVSSNLSTVWTDNELLGDWDYDYIDGALRVAFGDANSRVNLVLSTFTPTPLSLIGDLDVTATHVSGYPYGPGLNLYVDFDNNDATSRLGWPNGIDGTLVYEEAYGQGNASIVWLAGGATAAVVTNAPTVGGSGSAQAGTVNDWLVNSSTAQVEGVALNDGRVAASVWDVTNVTIGCIDYTFDFFASPEETSGFDKVEITECDTEQIKVITTPWTLGWVIVDGQWVPGVKNYGAPVITYRDATVAELDTEECPLPEQPDPRVVPVEVKSCDVALVHITTFTYGTHLVDRKWVEDTEPVITHSTRVKTNEENILCDILAYTPGGEHAVTGLLVVLLFLSLGGVGIVGDKLLRSREVEPTV